MARGGDGHHVIFRRDAFDATRGSGLRAGGATDARSSDAPRVREPLPPSAAPGAPAVTSEVMMLLMMTLLLLMMMPVVLIAPRSG